MAGTAAIILNKKGEVLLGKRLKEDGYGYYAAPGGAIEKGEEADEACVRECEEETGLILTDIIDLPTTGKGTQHETEWFLGATFYGTLENKEAHKCAAWEWFPLDALPQPLWGGVNDSLKFIKEKLCSGKPVILGRVLK